LRQVDIAPTFQLLNPSPVHMPDALLSNVEQWSAALLGPSQNSQVAHRLYVFPTLTILIGIFFYPENRRKIQHSEKVTIKYL
jgi:hypothetical protein